MATKRARAPTGPSNLHVSAAADEVFEVGEQITHGRTSTSLLPAMIVIEGVRQTSVTVDTNSLDMTDEDGFVGEYAIPGGETIDLEVDATRVQLIHSRERADRIRGMCQPEPAVRIGKTPAGTGVGDDALEDDGTYGFKATTVQRRGKPEPGMSLRITAFLGKNGAVRPEVMAAGLAMLSAGQRKAYLRALGEALKREWPSGDHKRPNEPAAHMSELVMALEGYEEGHQTANDLAAAARGKK